MPTLIQKGGRMMLENRARRLLKLLELDAPDLILCEEAMLVFRAACSIDPELAGAALAKSLRENHAREKHICLQCLDAVTAPDDTLCAKCIAEYKQYTDDDDDDDEKSNN